MKKSWKMNENGRSGELFLNGKSALSLHLDERHGYYASALVGNRFFRDGIGEKNLGTRDVSIAQKNAELWLAQKRNEQIALCKKNIASYEGDLVALAELASEV
jgi:hypothetical protein